MAKVPDTAAVKQENGPVPSYRGFLVHAYADVSGNRLFFTGRLEDGRSFAAADASWRPYFHIYEYDAHRCLPLLSSVQYDCAPSSRQPFEGTGTLLRITLRNYRDRNRVLDLLAGAGIATPDGDIKPPDLFLMERGIRGPLMIRGTYRSGTRVDAVFPCPELLPLTESAAIPLMLVSADIETDTRTGAIRAVSLCSADVSFSGYSGLVRIADPAGIRQDEITGPRGERIIFHAHEESLLRAFVEDIRSRDPDIITGWNFLDFDFPRLADRCSLFRIPFALGRSPEPAKFFASDGRRSAAALVPGRQIIDALRIARAGPERFPDNSLETVSRSVLGEGKDVASSGAAKIEELDRMYGADPEGFASYCYGDSELVLRILEKTGLFRLTMERASLTGVSLDKAWTSVVSFERIYGAELFKRDIAPIAVGRATGHDEGAAGGTLLDPQPGLFRNVAVFDFRSLYPSIMRTFNVDPLAYARSGVAAGTQQAGDSRDRLTAPNGAAFSREPGIMPELIAAYFRERRAALDAGDTIAAHVYKILMNSFYGVLGTGACRYGKAAIAGAITSYARKWLLLSRDWFVEQGYTVLYGDTDSLFIETGLPEGSAYGEFLSLCSGLASRLNTFITGTIDREYGLESFLELRFEKVYTRFLIPPIRALRDAGELRGRAKGYAGYLLGEDSRSEVEVKGMEAVRRDTTPLARRLQLELLDLVFSAEDRDRFKDHVVGTIRSLKAGELDRELIYRKRLTRPPESYTASTPPQVKAARALGWKGRRGTVEYLWTMSGPEPTALQTSPLDYDHYIDSQVLPVAESIAAALGWNEELFPHKGRRRLDLESGQMELGL
ncbi:DNA polymerase domain-containing protein [Breznakiella homolactica]|uniref:DNA polymerase n=1 Tax=Breznakiella homolactica TaxID=2798577 RepID=A0A7T8BAI9_9SPIR|nr:DNA polymerase domain-containing protein [Breznakiella homolactica]QQO10729.1 DNA polymerase II [Breznakiella homolactica]